MTLKELLAKNAAIAARRAQEAEAKKLAAAKTVEKEAAIEVAPPVGVDTTEEILDEGKKEEKRTTSARKRGRKPAQRTYMVAEDVEKANALDD